MVRGSQNLTRIQLGESKRRYEAHFVSKLSDCEWPLARRAYGSVSENSETDTWLDYARDCEYITLNQHKDFARESAEVGKMLGSMLKNPYPFLLTADR